MIENDQEPIILPGQIFLVHDDRGYIDLQETLVPSGKKKPPIPEQICLSLPISEEKS